MATGTGKFAVILPAAGRSSRFGNVREKKVYAELEGRAVWLRSVDPFVNRDDVAQVLVVIAPEDREHIELYFNSVDAVADRLLTSNGR